MEFKSIEEQKRIWPQALNGYTEAGMYSNQWGKVGDKEARNMRGDILGDYHSVFNNYLMPSIEGKTVLEIGSFEGKWTYFMKKAKKVIAVDITDDGFKKMQQWPDFNPNQYSFYLTKGYELEGIESGSVDFVFSMDSLVRSEKDIIDRYLGEIKRVLAPKGKTCIHLPCEEQHLSWELGFTQFNVENLKGMLAKHGFKKYAIDCETIKHGVLLIIIN